MEGVMENKVEKKGKRNWWLLPLEVILFLLPLIIRLYVGNSGYEIYSWWVDNNAFVDIFLYYRMLVFIGIAGVVLVLVIWKLIKMEKAERKKSLLLFCPLFIYLGFVTLSTVASVNLDYSLKGAMDQFEPFPVLLGYVIVALYAYIVINTLDDVKQITNVALLGAFVMSILGVLQAIGKDPLALEPVQRLFADIDTYGTLEMRFPKGQAYGTLYNPNYVGSYVALYFPLMVVGFLISKAIWKKILYIVTAIGLLVFLFASQSRTGLISVAVIIFVFLLFKSKEVAKRWYFVIPSIAVVILVFLFVDSRRDYLLTSRLKEMFQLQKSTNALKGIDTTGNGVRVVYKDTEFIVRMAVSETDFAYLVLEGEEQKEISYAEGKIEAYVTLNNGDKITIQTAVLADFNGQFGFGLYLDEIWYYFTNQIVVGDYKYFNAYGRLDECVMIENPLQGYEMIASGRGYVLGRSIPLLWKYFFIGSGPDTFGITFPQNDYVARYNSGIGDTIYTRPHNFYVQMGVQTGVVSLIAFLVFYVMYFVSCCRHYFFKKFTKVEEWLGFSIFLATIGFMAVGLANDSLIVVSPMFYTLLGVGMAVNYKVLNKKEEVVKVEETKELEQPKKVEETIEEIHKLTKLEETQEEISEEKKEEIQQMIEREKKEELWSTIIEENK